MNFPKKFYQGLILLFAAILAAYLLSPFVFSSRPDLFEILTKGPSINKETKYPPMFLRGLFAVLAAFATVKGYRYWQSTSRKSSFPVDKNSQNRSQEDIEKYKNTLNTILSLEEKSDPPRFIKRKKKKITRKKSIRLSGKQTRKIIASSRSLSEFK